MSYRTLGDCIKDLENSRQLLRIGHPVSAHLEIAAIQRRAFKKGSPALLFTNVINPDGNITFPMLANLFGDMNRLRYIFRGTLRGVEAILNIARDPVDAMLHPWTNRHAAKAIISMLPRKVRNGSVLENQINISKLPQLTSWPLDGGGYVTLPQVYTESPSNPGFFASNTGMYRVQMTGKNYEKDKEAGLHYQIHRGIGYHHAEAIARGERLKVNIFIGGPPALSLAAIMPLPDNIPEICFAGALGGRRVPMIKRDGMLPIAAEADFCICGSVSPNDSKDGVQVKPEGPFGDHLGYYSLAHDFPLLKIDAVYHRNGAIWPFTTVGRPSQEDTIFGAFIHDLTGAMIPKVFSGVHEVHAVDAAGVHPLLLAIGSERYVPFASERQPQELLSCGMSLFGTTQTSLAKYLMLAAKEDSPSLSSHNIPDFFHHMLERSDFTRDLHFITRTTQDTLDYTGISLNQGSKLLWAVAGKAKRALATELPSGFNLPASFASPRLFAPGIIVCNATKHKLNRDENDPEMEKMAANLDSKKLSGIAMIVIVNDADFCSKNWENFLWVTFTRSDPATDIYGVEAFTHAKHWGCKGPIIIDARKKSFHAPELEEDPEVTRRVEALAVKGQPLHGLI